MLSMNIATRFSSVAIITALAVFSVGAFFVSAPLAFAQVSDISSVDAIGDISVANGTPLEGAGLPTTANVPLDPGGSSSLAVTWDGGTPVYDGNTADTYLFIGNLTLPEGVTNTLSLTAQVNVIVDAPAGPDYAEIFGDIKTTLAGSGPGIDIDTNIDECAVLPQEPTACTGLYFEKTDMGRVTFSAELDLTDPDTTTFLQTLGTKMDAAAGSMQFDASTAMQLKDAGATIAIYGLDALGYTSQPGIIVRDDSGEIIDPSDIINYPELTNVVYAAGDENGGSLTFDASHFTQFEVDSNVYVDGSNVDAEDGTSDDPYNTIQEGVTAAPAGGTALNILVAGVTIDGFTINASFGVYSEAALSNDSLTVKNNIITGTTRSVSLGGGGGADTTVTGNDLISDTRSMHLSGSGTYTDLKVNNNRFSGTAGTGIQFLGNVPINGLEFKDNEVEQTANLGSTITNGTVSGNTFQIVGSSVLGLQINVHDSTVTDNTFDGNGTGACFQLFGSQYGLPASDNVTVSDNTFTDCGADAVSWNYAIQLSQDISDITISNNTITNAYNAFNTRAGTDGSPVSWDLAGKNIVINNNSITGSRNLAVNNTVTGTLDATKNWWGAASGPLHSSNSDGEGGEVSDNVNFSPWYTDEDMTSLQYTTTANGDGDQEVTTTEDSEQTSEVSGEDVTVEIESGTTITGDADWDGTIDAPAIFTSYVI